MQDAAPNSQRRREAEERQQQLTKPPGSLGRLEALAIELAALQNRSKPSADRVRISVFAGDHGIAQQQVSCYPAEVTMQMIANFAGGGAAISVLARALGADLEIIDTGSLNRARVPAGVIDARIGSGTEDFSRGPAMTTEQMHQALAVGEAAAGRARDCDLFIGGDMGIGNTTSAAALASALLKRPAAELSGPGTGLDSKGVKAKAALIEKALKLHRHAEEPLEWLRRVGGFEIAALTGAFLCRAQKRRVVLVDGFISMAAALVVVRLYPAAAPWLLYSHLSAEPGAAVMAEALGARPLLDLDLRLGEGSGAAVAVPLLRLACRLHNEMATFAEAGLSATGD